MHVYTYVYSACNLEVVGSSPTKDGVCVLWANLQKFWIVMAGCLRDRFMHLGGGGGGGGVMS